MLAFNNHLIYWIFTHGIRIVSVLFFSWLIMEAGEKFISRIMKSKINEGPRLKTLINVFNSSLKVIIWMFAILTILPELGINPTAFLTGAGLVGLAIGMASKSLVQDYISGLFILLEDQFRVGDKVKVANIEGTVEEMTLRKIVIKDAEGVLHLIPNSQIKTVSKKPLK